MAKNGTRGGGRRGAIRGRIQYLLPNGHYAKLDRTNGRILAIKWDKKPFKGVIIVRPPERREYPLVGQGLPPGPRFRSVFPH